jgi:hypothetical protein
MHNGPSADLQLSFCSRIIEQQADCRLQVELSKFCGPKIRVQPERTDSSIHTAQDHSALPRLLRTDGPGSLRCQCQFQPALFKDGLQVVHATAFSVP